MLHYKTQNKIDYVGFYMIVFIWFIEN